MNRSSFENPVQNRYLEDYEPGSVHEFGSILVQKEEIIAFGRRFDPQVFHVDPEAAKETPYGGLIARGWHSAALMMRLFADHYLSKCASLGSPGVDALRWIKPARPGDRLSIRVTVEKTRRSRSKPDRGLLHSLIEVFNQDRELVMRVRAINFLLCREGVSKPHRPLHGP